MESSSPVHVLFVCLGNICRSPLAEGIFADVAARQGVANHVVVDSCGTAAYHAGEPPDPRSIEVARRHGIDIAMQRARRLEADDFHRFQLIVPMDLSNERDILSRMPPHATCEVRRLTTFVESPPGPDVPDPYYGGPDGFQHVYDLLESASRGLLQAVRERM